MRQRLVALSAALLAVLLVAAPVSAHPLPKRIDLPDGWSPEGITKGRNLTAYVGSLADGAIAKVNLRTGSVASTFAVGAPGRLTVGLDYDFRADIIWAAGGGTSEVRAYDAKTGAILQTYHFTSGFLNDVAVTRRAVYVTDSNVQQLIVIPLGRDHRPPDPSMAFTLPITGDMHYQPGFNANGIVGIGHRLVVAQSNTGGLFAIDGRTGRSTRILPDGSVTNADGLELHGRTLFIVRNQDNQVDSYRFTFHGLQKVRTLTDPGLDIPTTAAFAAGRLWVVNARFSTPATPSTDYWITALSVR